MLYKPLAILRSLQSVLHTHTISIPPHFIQTVQSAAFICRGLVECGERLSAYLFSHQRHSSTHLHVSLEQYLPARLVFRYWAEPMYQKALTPEETV